MSIYDKSSLVLIPSGTKTGKIFSQKPVSGDGDFTFTRSSAATRVNADGNIEKETQNLLTYSNDFAGNWLRYNATNTSGQSGYDGSSDATLVTATGTFCRTYKNLSGSGVYTGSIYVKAGTAPWALFRIQGTNNNQLYVNLSDGTYNVSGSDVISQKVESVGSGWYRLELSLNTSLVTFNVYPALGNADLGTSNETIYIQDAQLEQGLVARDYIETTTAAVYGGITDNTPRLDYTDSSCPALLLEPQRTNLREYSEYLGAWVSLNCTLSANNATSPEGVKNAYLITTTSNSETGVYDFISVSATHTFSVYAKAGTGRYLLFNTNNPNQLAKFDLQDGSIVGTFGGNVTASIEDAEDGWYRCIVTSTNASSNRYTLFMTNNANVADYGSASGLTYYLYGAQLEAGSYATSYIPTYGSSVSRVQDEADAFNAGDLITDNEGVLFVEFDFAKQDVSQTICLNNNNPSNRIGFWTPATADLHIFATSGGTSQFSTDTGFNLVDGETYKVAVKWTNNIVTAFANGNLIFTSSTITNPVNLYVASMNNSTTTFWDSPVKQYMVFPTALTDQEAIDLTTI
jgi:hypothetical protein